VCGFFCIVGKNISKIVSDKEIILTGKKYLHRGPDAQNHYFENEFKCYFRRLSIIDLNERSDQPFISDDGRFVILFNGEIYNFKILKKELTNLGQKFRTKGDTEVLIKAFQVWGKKFIKKIRGMFSICIWDRKLKKFYAYRDRFGIKPLYYTKFKGAYIFSSEIKDIIYLLKKKNFKENNNVVKNYLANSFLDDTEDSFYKDIKSVQPANIIEISNSKFKFEKYWSLRHSEKDTLNKEEVVKRYKKALEIHTISDVPIAYTLSGGIDSSLIAGVSKKIRNFNKKAKFFSIIPPNTVDESYWINSTVKKFNFSHSYVKVNSGNLKDYKSFLNFQDEPVQTASAYYQYQLRKKIKQNKLKVLMVGEGADEVYGGYKRCLYYYLNFMNFHKPNLYDFLNLSSGFMQNDLKNILTNYLSFKNKIDNKLSDIEDHSSRYFLKNGRTRNNFLDIAKNSKNFFKDALISHMTKRDLPYVLRMEDRNSMSQSIEARVPFLDHEMVEYIYNIKTRYFMNKGENKHILRDCFKLFFSKEVTNRKDKSARPGDNSVFIFNDFYESFIELLSLDLSNDHFDSKKIKFHFEKDKKNKFNDNSNFYFRVFNYLVWRDNSKSLI
jgi:asparagine synthase (glutamine-hydrolysing)